MYVPKRHIGTIKKCAETLREHGWRNHGDDFQYNFA